VLWLVVNLQLDSDESFLPAGCGTLCERGETPIKTCSNLAFAYVTAFVEATVSLFEYEVENFVKVGVD
jgi:hypothetical protein